ncbi:MAG: peptidoglycan-associated lipoprotein [Gallionellales bacterium GWA2_60_142]|jgi:peptidoglycan-associated lipoprotein|nr:MAG: peptidoglycan-associated lipoprotein [Gallionellales bacterium GWA2_60_142]HCI13720.1 peptidoglycan-associated lipoprotein Pal [Gallionellaceae bacterium]
MKKLVISLVLVNLLAACASNKPAETTAAPTDSSAKASASKTGAASATQVAGDPLNDPASILAKRSVYYPFDVDAVQDADKPVVQAHGKYLASNPNRKVRLEGNCDERGSNEYNLGLGQRRADGVKKMLELGGAKSAQLDSVSYGEEKPVASGHEEASWSQNRRTDIKYAK